MKPAEFWKNFDLGEELSIAGTFIYNGMRRFHEMQRLDQTDEAFEFLYNLSVGLERLLKVAVVLIEHTDNTDQEALEQSLITHNHMELVNRIKRSRPLELSSVQVELLSLLTKFYKTGRYDRFSIANVGARGGDLPLLRAFISKHLGVNLELDPGSIFGISNDERYQKFLGKHVLKLSRSIYDRIVAEARRLNLYTYELRHGSKAESVFLREIKISDEDVLWKELLIFLMNTKEESRYLEFLRGIAPLGFDPALVGDYLHCFASDASKAEVMDELDHLYSELEAAERKDRLENMKIIGDPRVYFDEPDEDESDGI